MKQVVIKEFPADYKSQKLKFKHKPDNLVSQILNLCFNLKKLEQKFWLLKKQPLLVITNKFLTEVLQKKVCRNILPLISDLLLM